MSPDNQTILMVCSFMMISIITCMLPLLCMRVRKYSYEIVGSDSSSETYISSEHGTMTI